MKKINSGFSLIEIIVYMSLLSILIIGVFSMVMDFVHNSTHVPTFVEDDYKLLIENFHEK